MDNLPDLADIIFIIDNVILGDAEHAVIISLINEFRQIQSSIPKLRYNFELSQFFAVDDTSKDKIMNCEIVLRYENTICITESLFTKENNKYFFSDVKTGNIVGIKSGIVKLFIKKTKNDGTIIYNKIIIVKIINNISKTISNNYDIKRIKNNIDIATCRSQTDTLNAVANTGDLAITNPEQIPKVVAIVNEIIDESNKSSIRSQTNKFFGKLDNIIPEGTINLANIIVDQFGTETDVKFIIVPDFKPIILQDNFLMVDISLLIVSSQKTYLDIKQIIGNLYVIGINLEHDIISNQNKKIHCACGFQSTNSAIINKIILAKKLI